jgi:hypothetical protein
MALVNVGAYVNGNRPPTKKALRIAMTSNPESVYFDSTSPLGPRANQKITLNDMGNDILMVCGPNPYTKRDWYATIQNTSKGIRIS